MQEQSKELPAGLGATYIVTGSAMCSRTMTMDTAKAKSTATAAATATATALAKDIDRMDFTYEKDSRMYSGCSLSYIAGH
ncbi:MAG: hypothetical protein K6D96_09865 [Acetatifactor sp.]|nr:hypothetical protein [Acetatifactor sp.]